MAKKKSKLQIAQETAQAAIQLTNQRIQLLGELSGELYKALVEIQNKFDKIRNVPSEHKLQLKKLKEIRLNWKKQAEKIENDYEAASKKALSTASSGILAGVGIAALGPTAAMGVATTFGVASTGTAISALSGAAATNAALAWLGGGAIAAGGGGMAAGEAFLAMAGPIGWAVAGVALIASGVFYFINKSKKNRLNNIFTLISERDVRSYELAIVELNERISRVKDETPKIWEACGIISTFGLNYAEMTEEQQYSLGAYVNLMLSTTQLLVNPILGLQPKYTKADLTIFTESHTIWESPDWEKYKSDTSDNKVWDPNGHYRLLSDQFVPLANLLYSISLENKDLDVLYKTFRKNDEFLKSLHLTKDQFNDGVLYQVRTILDFQKEHSQNTSSSSNS